MQNFLVLIVRPFIIKALKFPFKNWNAKLSKRLKQSQVVPYLLRNAVIDAPNQAWSIDITYIPMKRGFLYLTAIIDWYSRCIVGWELDDTLDTRACIETCKKALRTAKPLIINSDQGCQFTSIEYKNFLKVMRGRGIPLPQHIYQFIIKT